MFLQEGINDQHVNDFAVLTALLVIRLKHKVCPEGDANGETIKVIKIKSTSHGAWMF